MSDYTGDWALIIFGQALDTAKGFVAVKLGEDAAIIGTIIVLTLLTRDNLVVFMIPTKENSASTLRKINTPWSYIKGS